MPPHEASRPTPAKPKRQYPTADAARAAAARQAGGALAQVWSYPGDTFRVARFRLPDGDKTFRPIHRNSDGWALGDPPCGYSLTGDTSEQCFFVLHGKGANGKTVSTSTFRYIFGPYGVDPGFGVFEAASRLAPHPEQLAVLAGKRFITAAETSENTRLNEQRLKVLAHGDSTSARHMYGTRFEFAPEGKIWLAVNHKPRVDDDFLGFWRSARLIPFNRQFIGDQADKRLTDKLKVEPEGLLAWLVAACLEWQLKGLGLPSAVQAASDIWRSESDPVATFLDDHCIIDPQCQAAAADIYRAYQEWATDNGLPERMRLSHTAIGRRLGERFRRDRQSGPGRRVVYQGIGLLAREVAK